MSWEHRERDELRRGFREVTDALSAILGALDQVVAILSSQPAQATTAVLSTQGEPVTTTDTPPLFNLSATVANTSGAPLLDDDGVTAFVQPSPIPVDAGATEAVLTFVDANGDAIAPPTGDGSGLVVTFASDNPEVTLGTASGSGDTATASITVATTPPPPPDQATTGVLSTS